LGSTTTQTTIINRSLQLLGYKSVGSITDNDRGARAMNRAYSPVKLTTLRSNFWSFAIMRATLAASATPPPFGMNNYFPLPGDFLMLAMPDQLTNYPFGAIPMTPMMNTQYQDYQIENAGGILAIASNQPAPLQIRYVSSNVTESMFDPCFEECFACNLAYNTCEELTQSNTKLTNIAAAYKDAVLLAKQRNAFEDQPIQPPVDSWILARM